MTKDQYLRNLGQRFEALRQSHDPREELEALYTEIPQAHYAATLGFNTKELVRAGEPDIAYRYAREALRAGKAALDGVDVMRRYSLSGPSDPTICQSLEHQWSALAKLGAVATGQADSSRDGWLDLLRTRSAYRHQITGTSVIEGEAVETESWIIKRLCRASTELCLLLEAEAAAATAAEPKAPAFHNRADWLKSFGLTKTRIQKITNIDKETVQKMFDGQRVTETVLQKLVANASHFPRAFTRHDIPND
jgi:hypothetical protein